MGNKDARRQKTARIDDVGEVKPAPVEIPAIDCYDAPKSKPNKADLKRLKKERKKRQHAPLPPQILIRAKDVQAQIEPTLPNANLVPQLASRLHPDFSKPTSPSDRIFETDDEMLFWFSSGHLARVSPFFRDLFDLSLLSPYSIVGTDGASTTAPIPLHDTDSHGLALLFHVLLFEYTAYPVLPNDVLGPTFLGALVHAHELALRFDITLFAPIIAPFVVRHARVLRLTKPFEAFTLALVTEDPVISNEVIWLTLAHPLYSIPQEVLKVLEERYPDGLARLQQLHENVKPASLNLQYRMEFDDIPELPPSRRDELPECRRFACAITTGFVLEDGEESITRRLAASRVMEGLFLDEEVRPKTYTIVQRLNACELLKADEMMPQTHIQTRVVTQLASLHRHASTTRPLLSRLYILVLDCPQHGYSTLFVLAVIRLVLSTLYHRLEVKSAPVLTRPCARIRIYHPDSPSDYPLGGAIIECRGGISFRFPLGLLSASAPFAAASELSSSPLDQPAVRSEEVIDLSNVSPQGFDICLTVLHAPTPFFTTDDKIARLNDRPVEEIIEAFATADFLDIPDFAERLIPYFCNPFYRFALATGSKNEDLIQQMAEATFKHSFDGMQGRAEQLVIALNPSYHPRLRQLHETRSKIPKSLIVALFESRTCDRPESFAPTCDKMPCPAKSGRSWEQLKRGAANQVYDELRKGPTLPCERDGIAERILQGSCKGCARCKQRLLDSFKKEFKRLEADLPVRL